MPYGVDALDADAAALDHEGVAARVVPLTEHEGTGWSPTLLDEPGEGRRAAGRWKWEKSGVRARRSTTDTGRKCSAREGASEAAPAGE